MPSNIFLFLKVLCIAVIWAPAGLLAVTTLDLPEIGDVKGGLSSPEYERRLGQAFLREVRQNTQLVTDPEIVAYINSIGHRLASHSDNYTRSFVFLVVLNPMINAFAGPGGVIGINSGTILNSYDESELAAVIAHEIAHVTQRHLARMIEQLDRYRLPVAAAIVGAIILASQDPKAGQAALIAATGINLQNRIDFTRANEEEADSIGMQLLARARFDPRGMPRFFERLQHSSRYYRGNAPEFLRTHPLTSTRIANSAARAESYPIGMYSNSQFYQLIRAKLEVMSQKTPDEAVILYRRMLRQQGQEYKHISKSALRYGYAYALMLADDYVAARQQLDLLLAQDDKNIHYLLAVAQLAVAQRQYTAALAIYERTSELYPNNRPLILAYGRALLDAGRADKARELLHYYRLYQDYRFDPFFYDLLAQAETDVGNRVEGMINKVEYFYLQGETRSAIDILRFAEKQLDLNYYQKQRVVARRVELERELVLENSLEIR